MTIKEASKDMKCTSQFLRLWIQEGTCPFGKCIKASSEFTYYINEDRYKAWKNGKL